MTGPGILRGNPFSGVPLDRIHHLREDQAWLDAGRWEVDIAGTRNPARVSLRPMYDADMARIRA